MPWHRLSARRNLPARPEAAGTNVVARYHETVDSGGLEFNEQQHAVAVALDRILAEAERMPSGRWRDPAFTATRTSAQAARRGSAGAYIHGPVGTGKTMLMDMLYGALPAGRKRRLHYTDFMREVHETLKAARLDAAAGVDPIETVARSLAQKGEFLCLDEFSLTDSADTAIVSRLLQKLLNTGLVIVTTSNVEPDGLYTRGQNRDVYLPFIDLIKGALQVLPLDAGRDFRMANNGQSRAFFFPLNQETRNAIETEWESQTKGSQVNCASIELKGRSFDVPEATGHAARFQFSDLCQQPLGVLDFLAIAERFRTIFVDNVPILHEAQVNEARRFILLVDVLYDRRIRLFMRAAAPPSELYVSATELEGFEFARTASRLVEMASATWLSNHPGQCSGDG